MITQPPARLHTDSEGGSLLSRLAAGKREALLVRSTVDLAHALGPKVVAEGVETPEGAALLQGMGCDLAQGYYFARPMAFDAFSSFLQDAQPSSSERGDLRMQSG